MGMHLNLPNWDNAALMLAGSNPVGNSANFIQNQMAEMARQRLLEQQAERQRQQDEQQRQIFEMKKQEYLQEQAARAQELKQQQFAEQHPELSGGGGPSLQQVNAMQAALDKPISVESAPIPTSLEGQPPKMESPLPINMSVGRNIQEELTAKQPAITGIPSSVPGGANLPDYKAAPKWYQELMAQKEWDKQQKLNQQVEADKPYSLSAGQDRYVNGVKVASGPPKEKTFQELSDLDIQKAWATQNGKSPDYVLTPTDVVNARAWGKRMESPQTEEDRKQRSLLNALLIEDHQRKNQEEKTKNDQFKLDLDSHAEDLIAGREAPSQLPSRGAAGTVTRTNAITRAQQMLKERGLPPMNEQLMEANYIAGNKNQQRIRAMDAAHESIKSLKQASDRYGRSGESLLNKIILSGEVDWNNEVAIDFNTKVTGLIDDVASVLSGGGQATDSARSQATNLFNKSYSQGGMKAALRACYELVENQRKHYSKGTVYERKSGDTGGSMEGGGAPAPQFTVSPDGQVNKGSGGESLRQKYNY